MQMQHALVFAALSALTLSAVPTHGAALSAPGIALCGSSGGVTLEVVKANVNVGGVTMDTRAYRYKGVVSVPGPTIVMTPGETCEVTIANKLPGTACSSATHENGFHCPDRTNLHTHGLHIGPYQDDVASSIDQGQQLTYRYDMPQNHLAGTHWYHAHKHGSTALQLGGGMAGALLVAQGGSSGALPSDLASLYGTDGLGGTVAVLQHLFFTGGTDGGDAFDIPDIEQIRAAFPTGTDAPFEFNAVFPDLALGDAYVVNGQYQPTVSITADEVHLVRFVHAAGSRILSLELTGTGASSCEMKLLARDGVFQKTPYITVRAAAMFTGTRADIALRCGAAAVGSPDLAFAAREEVFSENYGGQAIELVHTQANVMSISVAAAASGAAAGAFPTTQATFPSYLAEISSATLSTFPDGSTTGSLLLEAGGGNHQINGKPFQGFEAADRHTFAGLCIDGVYEFSAGPPPAPGGGGAGDGSGSGSGSGGAPPAAMRRSRGSTASGIAPLQAATSMHPLHIHIDHMLITATPDVTLTGGEVIRIGEWRDTVGISAPNGFNFRMAMHDFTGDAVLHCHLVVHEDRGMMGLFERKVCGNAQPSTTPTPAAASNITESPEESPASDSSPAASTAPRLSPVALSIAVVLAVVVMVL